MTEQNRAADWERLLAQAAILQAELPGAVLVGGSAAALHAGHRVSFDHDHVLNDLAAYYDEAMATLESIAGWRTRRRIRGKLILGDVKGIDAGVRNLQRSTPLETTRIELQDGRRIELPTLPEMLRIKTFLAVERNATRDYLDVAALSNCLGLANSIVALAPMNELYAEFAGEGGDMLSTIVVKLTHPDPYDLTQIDLGEYKGIVAPWNDWRAVEDQCRALAVGLLEMPSGTAE